MFGGWLASISYRPVQRWRLGPLGVSPHGVGTAGGFLAGAVLMARAAERRGIPRAEIYNAVTWGAVGAIIGARGFYVLAHLGDFGSLRDVLAVWEGGLTMFGGFAGGLALGVGYFIRHGINVPLALDAAAPGFVAGVMIGRIGDLIIADHLGRTTNFFLGFKIPSGAPLAPGFGPPTYVPGAVVHQTALYDLLGLIVLAGFLALLARRTVPTGALFSTFAIWYGVQRFLVDFTRNRDIIESSVAGLSGSQWAGLAFAAGGAVALWRIRGRPPEESKVPEPEPAVVAVGATMAAAEADAVIETEPVPVEAPPAPSEPEPMAAEAEPEPVPAEVQPSTVETEAVISDETPPTVETEAVVEPEPEASAEPEPEASAEPTAPDEPAAERQPDEPVSDD